MSELQVSSIEKNDTFILYPQGYVNAHTVQSFERSIQDAIRSRQFCILINCRSLSYINSSGLGVLMGVIEEIQEQGGFLWLSNMNETVYHIFDTLGFTHLFKVFSSEEEALQECVKSPSKEDEPDA